LRLGGQPDPEVPEGQKRCTLCTGCKPYDDFPRHRKNGSDGPREPQRTLPCLHRESARRGAKAKEGGQEERREVMSNEHNNKEARPLVLTLEEPADTLRVSTVTVRRLVKAGRLCRVRGPRRVLIPWSELERFVKKNSEPPGAEDESHRIAITEIGAKNRG
jgi:excisionase family DNA binding protein